MKLLLQTCLSFSLWTIVQAGEVPTRVCPAEGQDAFILGGKNSAVARAERWQWLSENWQKTIAVGGRQTIVKPIKNTATMERAWRVGWEIGDLNGAGWEDDEVFGIGVGNGKQLYQYEDSEDGHIEFGEGLLIEPRVVVSSAEIGVHLLNGGERIHWIAYFDDKVAKEGKVDGVSGQHELNFEVQVPGGFDKILLKGDNDYPNTAFLVEYVEGCFDGNAAPTLGALCYNQKGRFSGDPHFNTFDGVGYDCQGKGEFVVVKSDRMSVQARFMDSGSRGRQVTVTKSIVFTMPDGPKIQVNVPEGENEGTCDYTFYVDDVSRDLKNDGTGSEKVTAVFSGRTVLFHHPTSTSRIEITSRVSPRMSCVLAFQVCLPTGARSVSGLLGTPNGDSSDDWTLSNGASVTIPDDKRGRRFQPAFDYCKNWCIIAAGETSLFKYTGGRNYSYYNNDCPTLPYDDTVEKEIDNVPQEVLDVCDDAEDFECIIDGTVGGVEAAIIVKDVECVLDELKKEPPAQTIQHVPEEANASGDPHFQTWTGERYDFHGVCDLVLLENRSFSNGVGMDVHVRTKQLKQWSYISNAVLRIGDDTLEVSGSNDSNESQYWVNGMSGKERLENEAGLLEETIAGYPITYRHLNKHSVEFEVTISKNGDFVRLGTWKQFVRVNFKGSPANFNGARGLMGTFDGGVKIARNNVTIIKDTNEFGREWQVLASEPKSFHIMEGPQAPQSCLGPAVTNVRRRLLGSTVSQKEAESACSSARKSDFGICVFDVMATGDRALSEAY